VGLNADGVTGQGLAGQRVTLGFKGGASCSALTTTSGMASCSVKAPVVAGKASISASFTGSAYLLSAKQSFSVAVIS